MGYLVSVVHLYLLLQVSLIDSCTDVLNSCFSGQYDYTDAEYLPLGLHLAVLGGESGNEQKKFCRNYQRLEVCVRKHIFSCPKNDPIWKKWTATELLNDSICSLESKQAITLYRKCSSEVSTRQAIQQCSSHLSWNASTYNKAIKNELIAERYSEFKEKYESCMKDVISLECPDEVKTWISKHFAASYFSQLCIRKPAVGCATSDPVLEEQQQCESTYSVGFTLDVIAACSAMQNSLECAVNAVAEKCGVLQAEQAKPAIVARKQPTMELWGCTPANIEIDAALRQEEADCTGSKTCARVENRFCAKLPYKEAMFPNSLGHSTLYTAQQAMTAHYPTLYEERCSSLISCLVCSLYFPVCSYLREPVLPCRTLCERVKQSCAGSWDIGIQCESLPGYGFCIDAGQCDPLNSTSVTTKNSTSVTTKNSTSVTTKNSTSVTTKKKDYLEIIIPVSIAAVILVILVLVAIIKRLSRNTENPLYGMGIAPESEERSMQGVAFSNNNLYEEIPDRVQDTTE